MLISENVYPKQQHSFEKKVATWGHNHAVGALFTDID